MLQTIDSKAHEFSHFFPYSDLLALFLFFFSRSMEDYEEGETDKSNPKMHEKYHSQIGRKLF